jgi:hypothetical protein
MGTRLRIGAAVLFKREVTHDTHDRRSEAVQIMHVSTIYSVKMSSENVAVFRGRF